MTEKLLSEGWVILIQFGAVGLFAFVFGIVTFFLVRHIINVAMSDKKLLIETLTTTVNTNTQALNNVAAVLRDMQPYEVQRTPHGMHAILKPRQN